MLREKTILLSSTNHWSDVYLSKHNYALELAKSGNIVFFLNPPVSKKLKPGEVVIKQLDIENLFEVSYRLCFPMFIRFRLPWIFNQLMKFQIYLIRKKINRKIDIFWDFNTHVVFFSDLRLFKADINIFHPVDKINKKIDNRKADITFSVSNQILDMVESLDKPKVFINHGLGRHYISAALEEKIFSKNNPLKVGYVGNLLTHCLDNDILETIIAQHPHIQFHFVGPYESEGNPLGDASTENSIAFVSFLKAQANVVLHGTIKSEDVINKIKDFDIFLICYKDSTSFANDNSHKILEYLSTGKVIVSTYINEYADKDFIVMSKKDDADEFCFLFSNVVNNIDQHNNESKCKKRIDYALGNTYEMQLNRIESALFHYSILKDSTKSKLKFDDAYFDFKQSEEHKFTEASKN